MPNKISTQPASAARLQRAAPAAPPVPAEPQSAQPQKHDSVSVSEPKLANLRDAASALRAGAADDGASAASPKVPMPSLHEATGIAARAFEGVEKISRPLTIGADALRLGDAYKQDGGHAGAQTAHVAGSIAGGWAGAAAGAVAGAEGGAMVGAEIGSLFGGVGAVPGAAIGALIGAAAGNFGGDYVGSLVGERAADALVQRKN